MRINRRNLLWAMAGLVMTKLVGPTSGAELDRLR